MVLPKDIGLNQQRVPHEFTDNGEHYASQRLYSITINNAAAACFDTDAYRLHPHRLGGRCHPGGDRRTCTHSDRSGIAKTG